jgi:hypothetical protein
MTVLAHLREGGLPGIMALLVFIPVVNLIFLYWFAFADWPNPTKTERAS